MALNSINDSFVTALAAQLPSDSLRVPDPRYLEEPRGRFFAQGGILALPRSAEEVSIILRACTKAKISVVPYGGGTGLVGGQVIADGPEPLILSLERLNRVRAIHALENVIVVEAGTILADVQSAAEAVDRLFPLSLAAEGSAQIGGNLATNAGGVNVLRYGNARDLCLGLEAVLPNGDIWNGLTRLRKDNTGYDLRNLLIGSEGSLGIITAAALKLYPRPSSRVTALLAVPTPSAALELLALVRSQVGEAVSAFELIHQQGVEFVAQTLPDVRIPLDQVPDWSVLIDLGLGALGEANSVLEDVLADAAEKGLVTDGVIAQSETQRNMIWSLREHIPAANKRIGAIASHDISLPLEELPKFIDLAGQKLARVGDFRINCFGHLGDGNLHYNVFPSVGESRDDYSSQRSDISRLVHDLVHEFGGSFSAEHGVGRLKAKDLERYADPVRLQAMRAIKNTLDPYGIMNPGAVLRAD